MASIETRKDAALGGDDDDDAIVGVPAPPPPSPNSTFARSQSSHSMRNGVPGEGGYMGASSFRGSSPNRQNKRSRSHDIHGGDGDERMHTLARIAPVTTASLDNETGGFEFHDDAAMDHE
jgi:hypothetical protein